MSKKKKKNTPAQTAPETAGGADFYFDEAVASQWQDYPEDELLEGEEYFIPETEDVPFDDDVRVPEQEYTPGYGEELTAGYRAEEAANGSFDETVAERSDPEATPAAENDPFVFSADSAPSDGQALAEAPAETEADEPLDKEAEKKAYASIKPVPGSYPYRPYETIPQRLFGQSVFYAAATAITGIYSAFWSILYYLLIIQRGILFKNAEIAMAARGNFSYTVVFVSPLQKVLEIMLYVFPVVLIVWVASLRWADKKGKGYGSEKMLITVLVLVCLIGVTALIDLFLSGLIFDVMKQ